MGHLFTALKQPEYVHILLNHLPLTGLGVALIVLLIGMVIRNLIMLRLGLALVGLFAFSFWPVSEFGEKGRDRVFAMADDEGRNALQEHEHLAERASKFYYALGVIAWIGFGFSWKWPKSTFPISALIILLGLFCLTNGFEIANEGGEIRHREFRS